MTNILTEALRATAKKLDGVNLDELFNKTSRTQVLTPTRYCGDINGDYGYEIDGVKSKRGYVSASAARRAMWRAMDKVASQK